MDAPNWWEKPGRLDLLGLPPDVANTSIDQMEIEDWDAIEPLITEWYPRYSKYTPKGGYGRSERSLSELTYDKLTDEQRENLDDKVAEKLDRGPVSGVKFAVKQRMRGSSEPPLGWPPEYQVHSNAPAASSSGAGPSSSGGPPVTGMGTVGLHPISLPPDDLAGAEFDSGGWNLVAEDWQSPGWHVAHTIDGQVPPNVPAGKYVGNAWTRLKGLIGTRRRMDPRVHRFSNPNASYATGGAFGLIPLPGIPPGTISEREWYDSSRRINDPRYEYDHSVHEFTELPMNLGDVPVGHEPQQTVL